MDINATLIGQGIAFFFFVLFCMKFVWPPILTAIEERQSKIANSLSAIELAKKEQQESKASAEQEIVEARKHAQEIVELANKRRDEILDEVRVEAESLKSRIIEQGYAEVETERKRVQEELRTQVASLAIAGAEKIIARSIDEAANNDIIDKLVAEL